MENETENQIETLNRIYLHDDECFLYIFERRIKCQCGNIGQYYYFTFNNISITISDLYDILWKYYPRFDTVDINIIVKSLADEKIGTKEELILKFKERMIEYLKK